MKYNIFKRLNTGGLELTPQEIRHALYQGQAAAFLKELSSSKEFLKVTCHSIKTDRMLDQEFVLRFMAVCYYGIENYDGMPEKFLNETMDYINQQKQEKIVNMRERFFEVMITIYRIFDNYAFRKMAVDGRRRPINKAIYEMWCKSIYDLDDKQRKKLIEKKHKLLTKYIKLCEQNDFQIYVKASDKYSYIKRVNQIKELVEEVIND